MGDVDLATYLYETGLELEDVYRNDRRLDDAAGRGRLRPGDRRRPRDEARPAGHRAAAAHRRRRAARPLPRGAAPRRRRRPASTTAPTSVDQRLLAMLHFGLWRAGEDGELRRGLRPALAAPGVRGPSSSRCSTCSPSGRRRWCARSGCRCRSPSACMPATRGTRRWRPSASGRAERPPTFREGPWWDEASQCDVFFVTLAKSEKDYSPTTLYRDYAISPDLFHWESQSTTSDTSPTGQRYINHQREGSHVLLFVREYRTSPLRHGHAVHGARPGHLRPARGQPADGDHVAAAHADAGRAVRGRPGGGGVVAACHAAAAAWRPRPVRRGPLPGWSAGYRDVDPDQTVIGAGEREVTHQAEQRVIGGRPEHGGVDEAQRSGRQHVVGPQVPWCRVGEVRGVEGGVARGGSGWRRPGVRPRRPRRHSPVSATC